MTESKVITICCPRCGQGSYNNSEEACVDCDYEFEKEDFSNDKRPKSKPTKEEMDKLMALLAVAKHIIHCKKCAQLEADIFNHAQIPTEITE